MTWARAAGVEPMLAVNMGTRGLDAARRAGRVLQRRARHRVGGPAAVSEEPYGVHVWCIGNEMDGPWQLGHLDAVTYGKLANETGKAMRLVDPSIELVVCGSSHSRMPTFGAWEDTVLDLAWDVADHISLHTYYDPARFETTEDYLAASLDLDRMIDTVAATADAVAGRKRSRRKVSLSVDEWNVWYQTPREAFERKDKPFEVAPPLIEDTYTITDALVVGCMLITLLRHADRVRMACLAQLVNVIAPIRTRRRRAGLAPDDVLPVPRRRAPRPRDRAARGARRADLPDRGRRGRAGAGATAVHGEDTLTLFAVNRDTEPLELSAVLRCAASVLEHVVLADDDPRRRTPPKRPSGSSRACSPARGSTASGCARRCHRGPGTCCGCASEARLTVVSLPTAGP